MTTETKEVIAGEMDKLFAMADKMANRQITPIERLALLEWAKGFKDSIQKLLGV